MGFIGLILTLSSYAFDLYPKTEKEIQNTYRDFKKDFDQNPYYQLSNINLKRDSIPSGYISYLVRTKQIAKEVNNAFPYTDEQIKVLKSPKFISFEAFRMAIIGGRKIAEQNPRVYKKNILTLVDFTQPTTARRQYVLDLSSKKVLFHTIVAHGEGSAVLGSMVPKIFSNTDGSHQSSLGFYVTELATYTGTFKYSLRIRGQDSKLNSNAYNRAIVYHNYHPMDIESLVKAKWNDPTTWGCFGMPILESGKFYGLEDRPISELVMDTIVGGSIVFAYSNVVNLWKQSDWLK